VNTITGTGSDLIDGKFDLQPFARRRTARSKPVLGKTPAAIFDASLTGAGPSAT
jgi:hypothetical protein